MSFTDQLDRPAFLLIDGMSLLFRSYFAIPPLTNRKGIPTNAVHGFFSIFLRVVEQLEPAKVAFCFDRKETTRRKEAFPDYKANRESPPDDLITQIPIIRQGIEAFNFPLIDQVGIEADDLIASISHQHHQDHTCIIYSSDFDLLQLANDHTLILTPHNQKQRILIGHDEVVAKYGITPLQIPDFKGLCGDSSDNLPGVKGIGKKTATKLLQEYQTLENIYNHLDKLSNGVRNKLENDKKMAHTCKELATLYLDLNIPTPEPDYYLSKFNQQAAHEFCTEYDLHSVVRSLPRFANNMGLTTNHSPITEPKSVTEPKPTTQTQLSMFE